MPTVIGRFKEAIVGAFLSVRHKLSVPQTAERTFPFPMRVKWTTLCSEVRTHPALTVAESL